MLEKASTRLSDAQPKHVTRGAAILLRKQCNIAPLYLHNKCIMSSRWEFKSFPNCILQKKVQRMEGDNILIWWSLTCPLISLIPLSDCATNSKDIWSRKLCGTIWFKTFFSVRLRATTSAIVSPPLWSSSCPTPFPMLRGKISLIRKVLGHTPRLRFFSLHRGHQRMQSLHTIWDRLFQISSFPLPPSNICF